MDSTEQARVTVVGSGNKFPCNSNINESEKTTTQEGVMETLTISPNMAERSLKEGPEVDDDTNNKDSDGVTDGATFENNKCLEDNNTFNVVFDSKSSSNSTSPHSKKDVDVLKSSSDGNSGTIPAHCDEGNFLLHFPKRATMSLIE